MLVFDGIRMGATIALNGKFLGNISDQFLRYRYPVHDVLLAAGNDNVLEVTFHKSIATGGRYTYRCVDLVSSNESASRIRLCTVLYICTCVYIWI